MTLQSTTIGNYLLSRLSEMGIRHILGVPGDFNLWFLEQTLNDGQIAFVGCCNELNAAYAADGYSRLAGISALATTYGVGELAALSGVAGAYAEHVPIVCITGAPPLSAIEQRALLHHTMADGNYNNMLNCYREFTVAQARLTPSNAGAEIDRILRACWIEKRPVYLQLPSDVSGVITRPPSHPLDLNPELSDPKQLECAVALISRRLAKAKAPAILIDADADRYDLVELVALLAEANNIPIAHLIPAKGSVSDAHPQSIGIYRGAASAPEVRQAIEGSDCLICLAARFTDIASGFFTHRINADLVIDLQPFTLCMNGMFFNSISAAELLSGLLTTPRRQLPSASVSPDRPAPSVAHERVTPEADSLTQDAFWRQVQNFLQPGDVIVSDTGTPFFGTAGLMLPEGASFVAQPIWAALGYALPAILGTILAAPNRRQLLFLGDGAIQMTAQELSTILRLDLKPIIFLINNDGYTIERLILGENSSYNDINPWRYGQLPAAFDRNDRTVVHLVRTNDELYAALAAAGDTSIPHLIEVIFPRMEVPEPLARFARRAAEFDFPQIREEEACKEP
jgi:indolepyruvate decarboxylase